MGRSDRNLVITYNTRKRRRTVSKAADESLSKEICETGKAQFTDVAAPVCQFCLSSEDNEVDLGPIHQMNGVTVHYFCMLLSSGLVQTMRPSDKRSLLGFSMADINKELKRGKRLNCCFCRKKGATIGCSVSTCRKTFHLCCGRRNGTKHHFFETFRSFCADHWFHPGRDKVNCIKGGFNKICLICQTSIGKSSINEVVCPPCCKGTYFHHSCMQRYALSAGMHFFKCPLCNATKDFQEAMLLYGLYIPDRDASWEKEPNAFHELLDRQVECNASPCVCPHGNMFNARSGGFKLMTCCYCGSYSAHKACLGISRKAQSLVCHDCGGT